MDEVVKRQIEHGDFQTPESLADRVCKLIDQRNYKSLVEPNCGLGSFVLSGIDSFKSIRDIYGFDINQEYIDNLKGKLSEKKYNSHIKLENFFEKDWDNFFREINKPILVIGNPPWVTNSKISSIQGVNIPSKSNFQRHKGFDAVTGKSNFDISEWMLIELIHALQKKDATMAMVIKSSVARKILKYCWKRQLNISNPRIYLIDAKKEFNVSVDACVFLCDLNTPLGNKRCKVYPSIESKVPSSTIGYINDQLIANIDLYKKHKDIFIQNLRKASWRSGVKHDCSKVMELTKIDTGKYLNGYGQKIELEEKYIFPLLKSSDVYNNRSPKKYVIITQMKVSEDTLPIKKECPKLWSYLQEHSTKLNSRKSSIYKGKPPFSIFGIGDYSFKPWKIAISGFYKIPKFNLIGSMNKKPIMVDDTVNMLAFDRKKDAEEVLKKLQSQKTQEALQSITFWDSKRPITIELLNSLDV